MHWIDPDCLPAITGTVERFICNPHGEIDGLVMTRDDCASVLVHTPPHLEKELTAALKTGDRVAVRGVRPRGADLVAAVSFTLKDGQTIVDEGPDPDRKGKRHEREPRRERMEAEGTARLSLFGPEGELRGALLGDGTAIRVDPKSAKHCAELLRPGAPLAVRGDGLLTAHGRVIVAKEIGRSLLRLQPVKPPKHDRKKLKAEKHEKGRHHEGRPEAHADGSGMPAHASR